MNAADVHLLYEYNRWANDRVFEAVTPLAEAEFTKDLGSSFRSVRDTMTHIVGAEFIWLRRWKGTSPKSLLDPAEFPTLEALRARWAEVASEQAEFVGGLTAEKLRDLLSYTNIEGKGLIFPLWQTMQHLVNHSSYHRGQVATLLRQLGRRPEPTDLIRYYAARA